MRHLAPWALGMLSRVAFLAALCSTLLSAGNARAQDLASTIVGVWKVLSVETKEVNSGKAVRPLGDVIGTFVFTRGGRFSGMVFSVNRKAPAAPNATEAERVALFNSMVAYNGVYRIDGNKLDLTIDNSHIQSWNGTQRPFTVELSGTRLMGRTAPLKAATTGLDVFAEFIWEKLE
jgi:lipocalin-like protein